MWVDIYTKVETYDNTQEWLILEKSEEREPTKRFIKTIDEVDSAIKKHIELLTNSSFDIEMAESFSDGFDTIIYHHPVGEKHLQFSVRAEVNKKKVELDKYYLNVA
jgi:hypothetical protein